eukprot:scaffold289204_cov71-Attheya_sp.AAC.3
MLKKGGTDFRCEAFFRGTYSSTFTGAVAMVLLRGGILEAEEPLVGMDYGDAEGLEVEVRSTIIRSEVAASSRSSFMDLLLDLALHVIEGGWVMGTELNLRMCFDLDIQSAEGDGLGNGRYGA